MEDSWGGGLMGGGERQDLDPITEEEDRSYLKDSQSDSSDTTSTMKRNASKETTSDVYDSSATTSTSEPGDEYPEVYSRNVAIELPGPPLDLRNDCRSQSCLCQNCLMGYTRAIAFQGNMSNSCAVNAAHLSSLPPFYATSCPSAGNEFVYRSSKEPSPMRYIAPPVPRCCLPPSPGPSMAKDSSGIRSDGKSSSMTSLPVNSSRCAGSLDRRRRRLRNRNERDQRARSHNDLICCDRERLYCSHQQFQYASNPYMNGYNNNTEERLRKLENERGALHMEVSVLSEQVDAQSNKIHELESILQEKKESLRQMEEALQREVISRSTLETQKLELLSSMSELKLKQASLEHENRSLRSNPMSNGERFSRHAGQYSSLPRPPTSSKKGVAFGKVVANSNYGAQSVPLTVKGISARCLSAPILAEEEKTVIGEAAPQPEYIPPKPLADLTMEEVGDWLSRLGLECYAAELRRWGATGAKLLEMQQNQIEKELDIKNTLHRKKLLYAIESERPNSVGFFGAEQMDSAAVLRWLDDIGLPQYKEAFQNAKIDGRVLHRLTTEDLLNLGVNAQLCAASLRRGIQVLRELNFNFDSLERRSINGNGADGRNVTLWTNHRVMEWLRVVDLAEYAPNMRGSGVHGGLMVHEGRFTSELLATLLSIPPGKTLLRRHLTTHFNQLLGREVVQHKREIESTLGFVPLTLTARLKVPKKSQFTLKRKKSKNEVDYGNLVCPLEPSPPGREITEHKRVIGCI
ncbi:liprin-beta-1 isoform X2 [Neodiprion fabricii]|uniref:liprin-beta-1 isoform X2 n=1 Tax=Neodiprion fabricii TaxID=2872261 RepID=UPI001ED92E03|nr:liprin-beta-1 isoform X2 [Neodiprion fabricii]